MSSTTNVWPKDDTSTIKTNVLTEYPVNFEIEVNTPGEFAANQEVTFFLERYSYKAIRRFIKYTRLNLDELEVWNRRRRPLKKVKD